MIKTPSEDHARTTAKKGVEEVDAQRANHSHLGREAFGARPLLQRLCRRACVIFARRPYHPDVLLDNLSAPLPLEHTTRSADQHHLGRAALGARPLLERLPSPSCVRDLRSAP